MSKTLVLCFLESICQNTSETIFLLDAKKKKKSLFWLFKSINFLPCREQNNSSNSLDNKEKRKKKCFKLILLSSPHSAPEIIFVPSGEEASTLERF